MKNTMHFEKLLPDAGEEKSAQLALFAVINLGIIDSLASGMLTASDAVRLVYHGDNCKYVREILSDKTADKVMSHGVQLPDLFEALPAEEAHRQLHHELQTMRAVCLKILDIKQLAA